MIDLQSPFRRARAADARDLAWLIDRAGEGIPMYLWGQAVGPGEDPLEFGTARAARTEGGFSFTHAIVCEEAGAVVAMLLGYPLDDPYELGDLSEVPPVVVPMLQLEARAPGSWYVNAIAVDPTYEGRGIGRALMAIAEELGRECGATEISLIVAEENGRAKALYESLRYAEHDRRRIVPFPGFAYGGDWVLMVKRL
jgi:ribosomal protein S18 acetylase RimI-like enzyme